MEDKKITQCNLSGFQYPSITFRSMDSHIMVRHVGFVSLLEHAECVVFAQNRVGV